MNNPVRVAGVGMIPFTKPGTSDSYDRMGEKAVRLALTDAAVDYGDIGQAYAGYVYGDSTSGQAALYRCGMTGIPVVNVNNNCSSGSSALFLARQAIASGMVDCAVALGFEQMTPGALSELWTDRPTPMARFLDIADDTGGDEEAPMAIKLFGGAGKEYQEHHGTRDETFARIAVKARHHAKNNDHAIFRDPVSVDEVLASPRMYGPLTRLQCCPPTCGAAAAILVSEDFAKRRGLNADIAIRGQAMTTDFTSTFTEQSMMKVVGADLTAFAATTVYEQAGVGPDAVDVVELHDCFTANELITYEELGLTDEGTAERFVMDRDNTYGGKVVTNPSGGLLSKGHPLGATGLAQCAELVWQLRGQCNARQVDNARIGLQHNIGLGGACVVTLYEQKQP